MDNRSKGVTIDEEVSVLRARMLLAEAAFVMNDIADRAGQKGLHTAAAGWERFRHEVQAMVKRAKKMPR